MWDIRKTSPEMFEALKADFEKEYAELNDMNLTKFYEDTAPVRNYKITDLKSFL